jgi:L-glutamine:2-deoxy-scyllo-inosose/3-amino-2,3-dideoxy-scyllo-inosose aminotransferase
VVRLAAGRPLTWRQRRCFPPTTTRTRRSARRGLRRGPTTSTLAIDGGASVRPADRPWPAWPRYTEAARREVNAALESGRWAISGAWTGERCRERRFAERFAAFHGVDHCVPTANGSAALLVALEALDVGPGDEVIVPGLTWVANASAVLRANAVPILVDVDPGTLCVSVETARRALSSCTRAICVVHLYSSMADMDGLRALAAEAGVPLVEDCAQAHGAAWHDARAGTLGTLGVFSMQQTKVLTAGEGGAVITASADLARRLEQLRADGRVFCRTPPGVGALELTELGEVTGANLAMSEVQAALLLEGLARLDGENRLREGNARRLDAALSELPGVTPLGSLPGQTRRSYYHYVVRVDCRRFGWHDVGPLAAMLSAELNFPAERIYRPLNDHPLYRPATRRATALSAAYRAAVDPARFRLPECERAHHEVISFHHRLLLGDDRDMDDVIAAFQKVWDHLR